MTQQWLTFPIIDEIAFEFGPLAIRWYAIAYLVGILFAMFLMNREAKKDSTSFETEDVAKLTNNCVIGIIIGGRLGFVLFYNLDFYLSSPLEILKVWNGGMSFHGGLVGIIISIYIFTKINNINFFYLSDLVSIAAPIGLLFGRIANFINTELIGRPTEFFISVIYPSVDNLPRHPSQLYEAFFEGIILFFILLIFYQKGYIKIKGFLSSLFLIFYSVFRFVIEFFRAPDEQIGYLFFKLSMGQLISFLFFSIGLYLLFVKYEFKKK